jgi:hypothetical protein
MCLDLFTLNLDRTSLYLHTCLSRKFLLAWTGLKNHCHTTRFQPVYEDVTKSFRTGRLERKLQMVPLSANKCSCIAILWLSLVSFAAITLCVTSQRVFIVVSVYFVMTQSGNFWIHHRSSAKWLSKRWEGIILFATAFMPTLRPTQLPIGIGALFRGKSDRSPPSSAEGTGATSLHKCLRSTQL